MLASTAALDSIVAATIAAVAAAALLVTLLVRRYRGACTKRAARDRAATPVLSVNYHAHRKCNYNCHFCFHTELTSHIEPVARAKRALRLLRERGMEKLNFSGGEPLLEAEWLGELVTFAKRDLGLESVSIVTNGSRLTEEWMDRFAAFIDIIAVSCDSFDEKTCRRLGRMERDVKVKGRPQREIVFAVRDMCRRHGVIFKVNSVITSINVDEDNTETIADLAPARWKVFQMLLVDGENDGDGAKDQARRKRASRLTVSDEKFDDYVRRHRDVLGDVVVPESNTDMRASYWLLDEHLRFLDCSTGGKKPSVCLLEDPDLAIVQANFDVDAFRRRRGEYEWSRADLAARDAANSGDAASGCGGGGAETRDIEDMF